MTSLDAVRGGGDGGSVGGEKSGKRSPPLLLAESCWPLHQPSDSDKLCDLVCLVRQQLEVFVASPDDVRRRAPRGGKKDTVQVGRVGIRCRHCRGIDVLADDSEGGQGTEDDQKTKKNKGFGGKGKVSNSHTKGAVAYPNAIRFVYQAARNWQRHHILRCAVMPPAVIDKYNFLRQYRAQGRSGNSGSKYWEESIRKMGVIDTERGMRMRGWDAASTAAESRGATPSLDGPTGPAAVSCALDPEPSRAGTVASIDGVGRTAIQSVVEIERTSPGAGGDASGIQWPATPLYLLNMQQGRGGMVIPPSSVEGSSSGLARVEVVAAVGEQGTPLRKSALLDLRDGAARSQLEGVATASMTPIQNIPLNIQQEWSGASVDASSTMPSFCAGSQQIIDVSVDRDLGDSSLTHPGSSGPPPKAVRTAVVAAENDSSISLEPTPLRGDGPVSASRHLSCAIPGDDHAAPAGGLARNRPLHEQLDFSQTPQPTTELGGGDQNRVPALPRSVYRPGEILALPGALAPLCELRQPIQVSPSPEEDDYPVMAADSKQLSQAPPQSRPMEGLDLPPSAAVEPTPMRSGPPSGARPKDEAAMVQLGIDLSDDAILERTQLARNLVGVVADMRGTSSPEPDRFSTGEDQTDELRSLGEDLYELFSGRRPCDDDQNVAGGTRDAFLDESLVVDDASSVSLRRQKKKRGRQHSDSKNDDPRRKFTLLSEMGFPASLCDLVTSLLETMRNGASAGGVNGDRFFYHSVSDVEEDFQLLTRHPQKFLYDPVTFNEGAGKDTEGGVGGVPSDGFNWLYIAPDVLYGRERELSHLLEVYDRVIAHRAGDGTPVEMVLVSGYSGSGKSAIVEKTCSALVKRGARHLSAKFDAIQRSQPLFAIARVLNEYLESLLKHDTSAELERVKSTLTDSFGSEWRVLATLIPSLGTIIGSSEYCPIQIGGTEAKQRLHYLFRILFRAIGNHDNPIVFFLDDLQWADSSSLELLHFLVTDSQSEGLLFIGAYRENEVGPDHPLAVHMLNFDRSEQLNVSKIQVGNMDRESVNSLISDALHLLPRRTRGLTKEVMHKTGGNALFVQQFLFSLCDDGLLHFSLSTRRWEWDAAAIREKDIADNVVGLMKAKISRLAPEVHSALQIASVFGAQCDENVVQIIDRSPLVVVSLAPALDVAISEGLVVKAGTTYRFSHDQIWSAAYMCIPESERATFHLQVGRFLWRNSSDEELQTHLFVVVDQLHRGACHITDDNERVNLAELSLKAGHRASSMSAFSLALAYLKGGIGLLVDSDWESHRNICFDLHNSIAETECTLGNFDSINGHLEPVLTRSNTLQEKLRAYFTLIQSMGTQGDKMDAISTALKVLGLLGEPFPAAVTKPEVQREVIKTQGLLGKKTKEELLCMETMHNREKLEVMKLLKLTVYYDYSGKKVYMPLLICRMVQLSLLHGMCTESSMGFACYGFIISGGVLNDHVVGSHFGKLALALLDRFDAKALLPRVFCLVHGYITNWTEPIQSSLPCLEHAIDMGLRCGDTEWAMLNAHLYSGAAIHSGYPLAKLVDEMKDHSKQMVEYNRNLIYHINAPVRQTVLNLLGHSADPVKLVGEEMDEDQLLENAEEERHGPLRSVIYVYRTWLAYLFGQYKLAADTAQQNESFGKSGMTRFAMACSHVFYGGLSALALARSEGLSKWQGTIEESLARMHGWSSLSPWNCEHKLELMKAEYSFVTGNLPEAEKLYGSAIDLAAKHRFIHEQALALERAGIFYMENGNNATASDLFTRSHGCYVEWGAHCKAAQLKELYL